MVTLSLKVESFGLICVLYGLAMGGHGFAAITVPYEPGNNLKPTATVVVRYDDITQLYTYIYTVGNDIGSVQEVETFAVEYGPNAPTNIISPIHWSAGDATFIKMVMWSPIDIGTVPPEWVPADGVPPSDFQIGAGEFLGGFSFQSQEGPHTGALLIRGYTPIPAADDAVDFDEAGITIPVWTDDSVHGTALVPGIDNSIVYMGGGSPSIDGFVAFIGVVAGDTQPDPATFIVRFGIGGETVDTSTFSAKLNGVEVASDFINIGGSQVMATFDVASSPMVTGPNSFQVSVDGTRSNGHPGSDSDTYIFISKRIEPSAKKETTTLPKEEQRKTFTGTVRSSGENSNDG